MLDSLNWKLDHGPQVNQNLAKSLYRGIANVFCMLSLMDFAENYKPPSNCHFLCAPILNKDLFSESINSKFKKNDAVLQKT